MADIIDQAYTAGKLRHWDDFRTWLKVNARNVNRVEELIHYSQSAEEEGRIFPDSPEEARNVLKKYSPREWIFP